RSTIHGVRSSSFFNATSKRVRISSSQILCTSFRRRQLSSARHRSEQVSRFRGLRGPPHTAQTGAEEPITPERSASGGTLGRRGTGPCYGPRGPVLGAQSLHSGSR